MDTLSATEQNRPIRQRIRAGSPALNGVTLSIGSPSHQEHRRAAFCKDWLEKAGAKGVYIDEVQNVIFPINAEGSSRLTLFAAHMDTVFPDTEPMPMREEDGILYCPGAGDDTGSVALVLMISKYLISRNIQPEDGFLMVCNTCEEVDQSGITHVVDTYQGRLKEIGRAHV